MTETMLERIARAMWLDDAGEEFAGTAEGFADWEYQADIYRHRARVAVKPLLNPTRAMWDAGLSGATAMSLPDDVWYPMIHAILQEHPGTAHDDSQPASDDQHHHGSVEQSG